jgi:hypothetical protein
MMKQLHHWLRAYHREGTREHNPDEKINKKQEELWNRLSPSAENVP